MPSSESLRTRLMSDPSLDAGARFRPPRCLDPRASPVTLRGLMRTSSRALFGIKGGIVGLALVAAGCEGPPPPQPFQSYVKVESDPGRAIAGAVVSRSGKELG